MEESNSQSFELEDFAKLSLAAGFQYFKTMEKALGADTRRYMDECLRLKAETDGASPLSQEQYAELGFWYRGLARALLTYIEGILFVMRQLIIYAEQRGEIELSAGEATLVRELEYAVNVRRKKIEERARTNRFLENFVISFEFFPRVFGSSFRIDYGTHGWEKLQRLVKLRNDLTHPKNVQDTLLAPEMPNLIRDAAMWFFTCMRDFIASVDSERLEQSMRETAAMPEMKRLLAERRRQRER
jgi:hypothetical protein